MPQFCPRCKRANPNEATYCYFDGFVLQQGAAVSPVGQLAREFVFPASGRRCRSVDDIAQSCQVEWAEARELLARGEFLRYFSQAGRLDLSRAAQEAQANPDPDVALLQFVNNLPVAANPQAPRLDLTPRRIALGAIKSGEQRQMKITVLNQGKGLLQGKVAVSDGEPWLKLVDGTDPNSCPVQAASDQDVSVRVDSRGLVAGQAYSGKLTVVTNGGIAEVPLKLNVVAVPFARPPFQGATSPRGMAERMRTNPKQAVPLLENGEVQRWFEANGWKYPVAGTPARSIGGVQQFFECLGLSKPPPVMLSESELRFQVTAPEMARGQVTLRTTTKKWVYAQVSSDAAWLRPSKPSVSGPQQAQIGFEIDPALMDGRPQQEAMLRLIANGGQRLAVRVRVAAQYPRGFVPAGAPRAAAETVRMSGASASRAAVSTVPMSAPVPMQVAAAPPINAPRRPPSMPAVAAVPVSVRAVPAPSPFDWLPAPVEKPRPPESFGVRLLRPLVVGVLLALVFRLVIAAPAEIVARVACANREFEQTPGSLDTWRHSPFDPYLTRASEAGLGAKQPHYREEHFLRWFVAVTFWIGGVLGVWQVARGGGRSSDLLFGVVAGAAGGVAAAATAACAMSLLDGLPRAVLAAVTSEGSSLSPWGATPLWLALAALCWSAYGAGLAYLLSALGRGGTRVLDALGAPVAGLCRACGLRGLAHLFNPQ
jgi:hypothetical protein